MRVCNALPTSLHPNSLKIRCQPQTKLTDHKKRTDEELYNQGLDSLALHEFDCNNPCPDFLYTTDSNFQTKLNGEYRKAYNADKYEGEKILSIRSLFSGLKFVTRIPLDDYLTSISTTIQAINKAVLDAGELREKQKKEFVTKRYNLMESLASFYKKYEGSSLNDEQLLAQLIQWCHEYKNSVAEEKEL